MPACRSRTRKSSSFPVAALEALVERSDPVEHRPRHEPEAAVEGAGFEGLAEALAFADDERAGHGLR